MAKKEPQARHHCPKCGQGWSSEGLLQRCPICRTLFCQHCAVIGYGREFCSARCRDFFFHGDEDEEIDA